MNSNKRTVKKSLVSVVVVSKDRKKDLDSCLAALLKSTYKPLEVILIDNASKSPLSEWVSQKYPSVKIYTSKENLGAAEGRNLGIRKSLGDYILFTDDDASCGKEMIRFLVEAFRSMPDAGIIQPLVYDKKVKKLLQGAGHEVDTITGRLHAWGVRELDEGQYEGLRKIPLAGCVWMVKRAVIKKIGMYDKTYFIPYEDSDFSFRASKAGFGIYCYSKAKTWHTGIKLTFVHPWLEWLGITSAERAFRVARNKIIFMRKHAVFPFNFSFFFILLPLYIVAHTVIIFFSGKMDVLGKYYVGLFSGLYYAITYKRKRAYE